MIAALAVLVLVLVLESLRRRARFGFLVSRFWFLEETAHLGMEGAASSAPAPIPQARERPLFAPEPCAPILREREQGRKSGNDRSSESAFGLGFRCALLFSLSSVLLAAENPAERTAVIFNSNDPQSRQLAEYYARKRSVPAGQMTERAKRTLVAPRCGA